MSRRRILLLLALTVVAVAAFILFWPRGPKQPVEPVYQGKTFFQWAQAKEDAMTPEQDASASAGLNAIGTNALPFLMHDFTRSISLWRQRMNAWAGAHPGLKLRFRDDLQLIHRAAHGLSHLGSNAAPAAPVVARYLGDPARGQLASTILFRTGEPAVPQLWAALGSTNRLVVTNAMAALWPLKERSEMADRVLREWVTGQAPRGQERNSK